MTGLGSLEATPKLYDFKTHRKPDKKCVTCYKADYLMNHFFRFVKHEMH